VAGRLAKIYQQLEPDDFRVLRAIEGGLGRYEYVPVEYIERRARLPPSRMLRSIRRLSDLKLIRRTLGTLIGYTLTFLGLDVLAVRALHAKGVIEELGDVIGAGKESDVYIAVTPAGERVAVKFHKEGQAPFHRLRRTRSFAASLTRRSMILWAKMLGEREFKALVELHARGARVPEPIAWNRHAVVERLVEGAVELYRLPPLEPGEAARVLLDVLETVRIAYVDVGIVHGDLSEYNILVAPRDGGVGGVVIDWPQYVYREEPHARELLERDVRYVIRFFRSKYGVEVDYRAALEYAAGGRDEPPLH
jgi:RIO kinase 2